MPDHSPHDPEPEAAHGSTTARPASRQGGARGRRPSIPDRPSWSAGPLGALLERAVSAAGLVAPSYLREIDEVLAAKLARAPLDLNEYGYDPWGLQADVTRRALVFATLLYRHWFRVETRGIKNVPEGRVLLISNHAGQVALDGVMIATACMLEGKPPRLPRAMGEYWLPTLPFFNVLMVRTGSVVGTPRNCVDLLERGEAVLAFPEGVRGMNKSFTERYQLMRFGQGFLRLALQTDTPIVPIAVVGSEEQMPSLGNFRPLARLLGMPAFPLVLTPIPLPTRYHVRFGEPMRFEGSPGDEDAVIDEKVRLVKARIREMLDESLRTRPGVFA
ncbi:MAG: lysophospholipid acyltransferase family protein [Alphaproteobacteria bacterium]